MDGTPIEVAISFGLLVSVILSPAYGHRCLICFYRVISRMFWMLRESVADGRRRRRLEGEEGSGSSDSASFVDNNPGTYLEANSIGVPTEREMSVFEKGGEVYRVMFQRSDIPYRIAE